MEEVKYLLPLKMEEADYGIYNLFFDWFRKEWAKEVYSLFKEGKTIEEIKVYFSDTNFNLKGE